ncbi:hypothetical protein BJ878DRAFT_423588 [Calycina marina]|uniref:Uncharacterized protein n=1 Tax=Calycina marina TaxID=1763456 RepID=A0A9P7Z139_9HELO|nr:hypothetical protein BJ878DRAFT_423588 [Calycina marina]
MCSQSGNLPELTYPGGHSILESESEPDNTSRPQDPPPLASDMGMRYIALHTTDDVR